MHCVWCADCFLLPVCLQDVPDETFDGHVAHFIMAAAVAKRFVQSATLKAQRRRDQMVAMFKGFDVAETGEISSEDFMAVGEALHWETHQGKWTKRQNSKLHREMDSNADGLVVLEEFLFFYRSVIYDIGEEQFERGLVDFKTAVGRCCKKKGIRVDWVVPERGDADDGLTHDDKIYATHDQA